MKEQYKKLLSSIYLLILVAFIWASWTYAEYFKQVKARAEIPMMETTVSNIGQNWEPATGSGGKIEKLPFLQINSIGFRAKDNDLYIKFKLNGKLPEKWRQLPTIKGDQLRNISYYLSLNSHYFDARGNKNDGKPEADLKISFYGLTPAERNDHRIGVDGILVAGGPGYDYFIVKYPYHQILFAQTQRYVVFTAWSHASTDNYPSGIGIFSFKNHLLAATPQNDAEIKIDLWLEQEESYTL